MSQFKKIGPAISSMGAPSTPGGGGGGGSLKLQVISPVPLVGGFATEVYTLPQPVDAQKTFLLVSQAPTGINRHYRVLLAEDGSSISFTPYPGQTTYAPTGDYGITVQLVGYAGIKRVTRGSLGLPSSGGVATTYSLNVPSSDPYNPEKTVVNITGYSVSGSYNGQGPIRARLDSNNRRAVFTGISSVSNQPAFTYEIVEFA